MFNGLIFSYRWQESYADKWQRSSRTKERFEKKYGPWTETNVTILDSLIGTRQATPRASTSRLFWEKTESAQHKQVAKISSSQIQETLPLLKATSKTAK